MRPDPDTLPLLRSLHERVFRVPDLRTVLDEAFGALAADLRTRAEPPHATCVMPIELFTGAADGAGTGRVAWEAHGQVRLCRLFLLRRGARMAVPERHRNSVQRLVSYRGTGRIHQGVPGGGPERLWPRAIRSPREDGPAERGRDPLVLEACWDVVPAGVWHYPEADSGGDWATVTFHSAAEGEIEDELWSKD